MAGLELLHSTVSGALHDQHEALICSLHWFTITSGFKCIGCGDNVSELFSSVFLLLIIIGYFGYVK